MVQGDKTMKKINSFKALRIFNGLTQTKTSELMNISQGMVSRIDNMEDRKSYKYYEILFNILNQMYINHEIDEVIFQDGSILGGEEDFIQSKD